jgi:hypothetical protein
MARRLLAAAGLELGSSVGKFPLAGYEDELDEERNGYDPRADVDGPEKAAVHVHHEQGKSNDGALKRAESEGEEKFGPAPAARALLGTDSHDSDDAENDDEDEPDH